MASFANPASRLFRVIDAVQRLQPPILAEPALVGWANVFGVPPSETGRVLFLLSQTMLLPDQTAAVMTKIPAIDHSLFLSWVPRVNEILKSSLNLHNSLGSVATSFGKEVVSLIQICDNLIKANNLDDGYAEDIYKGLLDEARKFLSSIDKSDVDDFLKAYLKKYAMLIVQALEDYKIMGVEPVVAATERFVGSIGIRSGIRTRLFKSKVMWTAIVALVAKLAAASDTLESVEKLKERIQGLLPAISLVEHKTEGSPEPSEPIVP